MKPRRLHRLTIVSMRSLRAMTDSIRLAVGGLRASGRPAWVRSPKARPAGRPSRQATDPRDGPSLAGQWAPNTRVRGTRQSLTGYRPLPGPRGLTRTAGPHADPGASP